MNMKFVTYNVMALAFLAFSGWIAFVGGEWGWPAVAAFLLSVVPNGQTEEKKETEKPTLTEEERGLIDELKSHFKKEK
jgi:hypothetical protein